MIAIPSEIRGCFLSAPPLYSAKRRLFVLSEIETSVGTMMRFFVSGMLFVAAFVLWPTAAQAVIEVLTPLKLFIDDSSLIVVAKVEKLDLAKHGAVLVVTRQLKGKETFRRLPINLQGDKPDQTAELAERLSPDMPVVLFVAKEKLAFGYANGTWFQLRLTGEGTDSRGAFTHFETYLRRTFHGPTEAMTTALTEALAGKSPPPKPDPQEKPGIGPKAKERSVP